MISRNCDTKITYCFGLLLTGANIGDMFLVVCIYLVHLHQHFLNMEMELILGTLMHPVSLDGTLHEQSSVYISMMSSACICLIHIGAGNRIASTVEIYERWQLRLIEYHSLIHIYIYRMNSFFECDNYIEHKHQKSWTVYFTILRSCLILRGWKALSRISDMRFLFI